MLANGAQVCRADSGQATGLRPDPNPRNFDFMTERTRKLLAELESELDEAGELDAETRELLKSIHESLDDDEDGIEERAKELDARFAARYPTAERITRAIIDSLGKMGI